MNIETGNSTKLIAAADVLWQKVFIDEQGVPADEVCDGLNEMSVHSVVFDGLLPVATARATKCDESWRIGLVAVDKSMRGKGLGEKVMQAAINYISSCGGGEIILSAQQQVQGFYEKLGFEQSGEVTVFESGFVLVPMRRST